MDDKSQEATKKQVEGSLKTAIGKITGDTKVEAEGSATQESAEQLRKSDEAAKP